MKPVGTTWLKILMEIDKFLAVLSLYKNDFLTNVV